MEFSGALLLIGSSSERLTCVAEESEEEDEVVRVADANRT